MRKTKTITCTTCPKGCRVCVTLDNKGKIISIKGNECSKGEKYAMHELINPLRVLTSTIRLTGSDKPVISVKTDKPIPLNKMMVCMKELNIIKAKSPIRRGDVIIKNIGKTGANLIATGQAV